MWIVDGHEPEILGDIQPNHWQWQQMLQGFYGNSTVPFQSQAYPNQGINPTLTVTQPAGTGDYNSTVWYFTGKP